MIYDQEYLQMARCQGKNPQTDPVDLLLSLSLSLPSLFSPAEWKWRKQNTVSIFGGGEHVLTLNFAIGLSHVSKDIITKSFSMMPL